MDDIAPLQMMTPEVFQSNVHYFPVRKTTQFYLRQARETFARLPYAGKNPQYGAYLTTYFKQMPEETPKIVIKDAEGVQIFEIKLPKKKGLQRKTWNLQHIPKTKEGKQIKPGGGAMAGFLYAKPGKYTSELVIGEQIISQGIVFDPDPRISIDDSVWDAQKEVFIEASLMTKRMGLSVTAIKNVRRQLDKFKQEELQGDVKLRFEAFESKIKNIEDDIVPTGRFLGGSREVALRGGPLSFRIMFLVANLGGFPKNPTETVRKQVRDLTELVSGYVDRVNKLIQADIPELNKVMEANNLKPIKAPKIIDLNP
jgi:hypothetical protein